MYLYSFTLLDNTNVNIAEKTTIKAFQLFFNWYGFMILNNIPLTKVRVYQYVDKVVGIKNMSIETVLIQQIVEEFKQQNLCQMMKEECGTEGDPITLDDWCDIPYEEYLKKDEYLSQCYSLTQLLKSFNAGLLRKKGGNPFPIWPVDLFDPSTKIPVKKLKQLHKQAQNIHLDIPEEFNKFMHAIDAQLITPELMSFFQGWQFAFFNLINCHLFFSSNYWAIVYSKTSSTSQDCISWNECACMH